MDKAAFVETFGSIYEHSPWIAERAWEAELAPVNDTATGLAFALRCQFRGANEGERQAVIGAYSSLDGRIKAARLIDDPKGAESLDVMTASQQQQLLELLAAYQQRFGYGAVFVVRDYGTADLLQTLAARLRNDPETELAVASREVERLALLRVEAAFANKDQA
jgi:urate oxidase